MFVIFKVKNKQYSANLGETINIDYQGESQEVQADLVALVQENGLELVEGKKILLQLQDSFRAKKVYAFKKRRRKANSQRIKGHRQSYTRATLPSAI